MITAVVGYTAAALSVTSFLPQAWKIVKTRDTQHLATGMWVLNVVAFSCWITYGFGLGQWAIVIPNIICLLLSIFILVMKIAPKPTKDAIADVVDPAVKT